MPFVIRKFDEAQTLGQKLHTMRRAANFTLTEMADKTKIQKKHLKAFEAGAYNKLPDPIYARNFLKTYVQTLGGDVDYFLDQFEHERGTCDFLSEARLPRRRANAMQFLVASRFIKIFILAILSISLTGYIGYQVKAIIAPPELSIYAPQDGIMTDKATILVDGTAELGVRVKVNGQRVLLNRDGTFEIEIALERGLNIITIEATKRYSKPQTEYRRVVLEQDRSISLAR